MPAKYRSVDGAQEVLGLPGLEVLEKLGLGRLDGADCERRAFCELAVLGGKPEGNTAQRGLWKLANRWVILAKKDDFFKFFNTFLLLLYYFTTG